MLTAEQLRIALAILNIRKSELAAMCGLNWATIHRYEQQKGWISGQSDNIRKVFEVLTDNGIVFIENGAYRRTKPEEQQRLAG